MISLSGIVFRPMRLPVVSTGCGPACGDSIRLRRGAAHKANVCAAGYPYTVARRVSADNTQTHSCHGRSVAE